MFRSLHAAAALAAVLLEAGCAGSLPADPATAGNHPGNADAATAPVPPRSDTLRLPEAGSAAAGPGPAVAHEHVGPGENNDLAPLPGEADPMAGMDYAGQGGMPGMGAPAPAPRTVDQNSAEVARSADSEVEPAAADVATYWTCPMHPEVHEDGPGRCPICSMKIIEKGGDAR